MDPVTLAFYAIVCGCLGAVAPVVPRLPLRLLLGAAVGVAAAGALPPLRAALGL